LVPKAGIYLSHRIYNVLFICTHNSARSILAEAILNQNGAGRFQAFSPGSHPAGVVNPRALDLLERNHFSTLGLRSKNWEEFAAPGAPVMDYVLTVCDQAAGEVCPVWPGQPMTAHWGVPDPAAVEGDEEAVSNAFKDAFIVLNRRIALFLSLPLEKLNKLSLQKELTQIGQTKD
jgi:arsenate reductase